MLTVTAYSTLDNVAEDPNWTAPYFTDAGAGAFNDEVLQAADDLLLGRVTYEGFAAAWPSRSGDPFSDRINAMPKHVVSTTLQQADWNNTAIIDGDAVERIRALKCDRHVLVWGSPTLVRTLMEERLVDEYVLVISPIVRGQGGKLLPEAGTQHDMDIAEARVLDGGMLALRLRPR